MMKKRLRLISVLVILIAIVAIAATTIDDFFLPGSQVGQSGNIETPDKCDNCHGGYDLNVEPAFNWRGSMMSQAARDPLFYACLAVANQDAPGVGDMCLRCHTPDGWLNGRCVPTDGSALNNNDRQGVQCDFCHKMVKPTPLGVNPYPGNVAYTSTAYGTGTYIQDQLYLGQIIPIPGTTANGMYLADANNAKRGPFTDAVGRHQMFYSPFHSSSDHCGTCHDVSNPVFTRISVDDPDYSYNPEGQQSPTFDLRLMFPVERTYSEYLASGYANANDGIADKTCQDCHMKDVTGKGAKMRDAPVRTNLPLHDMTGGNTFTPLMVKTKWAAEVNPAALDAGVVRARNNLQNSATLELTVNGPIASVKVINHTGHKLPTGYPEGRRMWINLKTYNASNILLEEFGAYNGNTAELASSTTKVYHCEPGLSAEIAAATGLPAGPSYHFAINSQIYHDNRIPPAGFTNAALIANQSPVIGASYPDGQNWDVTDFTLSQAPYKVVATLYYQTTTKEYVEFLRDANTTNNAGQELYDLWVAHGKSAPELMEQATWYSGPPPTPQMKVASLSVVRKAGSGGNYYAEATALVTDMDNAPLAGATVNATWNYGTQSGTVTGTTGTNGTVILKSKNIKNATGQWCFTINNVVLTGYLYNSGASVTNACTTTAKSGIAEEFTPASDALTIYPNPVRGLTTIAYALAEPGNVLIEIFDNTGKRIGQPVTGTFAEGNYSFTWDAAGYKPGIYYCRMTTSTGKLTAKLVVVK